MSAARSFGSLSLRRSQNKAERAHQGALVPCLHARRSISTRSIQPPTHTPIDRVDRGVRWIDKRSRGTAGADRQIDRQSPTLARRRGWLPPTSNRVQPPANGKQAPQARLDRVWHSRTWATRAVHGPFEASKSAYGIDGAGSGARHASDLCRPGVVEPSCTHRTTHDDADDDWGITIDVDPNNKGSGQDYPYIRTDRRTTSQPKHALEQAQRPPASSRPPFHPTPWCVPCLPCSSSS